MQGQCCCFKISVQFTNFTTSLSLVKGALSLLHLKVTVLLSALALLIVSYCVALTLSVTDSSLY